MTSTRERVISLIKSGEAPTLAYVARIVGVSGERVRQIVRSHGSSFRQSRWDAILEWGCPDCNATVRVRRSSMRKRTTTYCLPCSRKHHKGKAPQSHCLKGHPLTDDNLVDRKTRRCRTCRKDYHRRYYADPVNKAREKQWKRDHADWVREYVRRHRRKKRGSTP